MSFSWNTLIIVSHVASFTANACSKILCTPIYAHFVISFVWTKASNIHQLVRLVVFGLSANEQYFSLTPNQPTLLLAMAYQPNKPKWTRRNLNMKWHCTCKFSGHASSQLMENGLKKPWRWQYILIIIYYKIGYFCTVCRSTSRARVSSKCSLFLSGFRPQRILQNTVVGSFHLQ